MPAPSETCQDRFACRWGQLNGPHVRALAWLLDSPDLLDPQAPQWLGKVAPLSLDGAGDSQDAALARWLSKLEDDPAALDLALGERVFTRLGLYAEKLMAFYFADHGRLLAHSLQVRAARNDTVGEFDFLLDAGNGAAEHWEFATKFYLLAGDPAERGLDALVGPNLADSLGAKMRKIIDKQLVLANHPAAHAILPWPVARARALVKGWLFYPRGEAVPMAGINPAHCNGFWCALAEVDALAGEQFVVLPRLAWLAPFQCEVEQGSLTRDQLGERLGAQFAQPAMPVLVAQVRTVGAYLVEVARGFVVPDDWRARAAL